MYKKIGWLLIPLLTVFTAKSVFAVNLTDEEQLGKFMYTDKDFSYNSTQSCMTCHHRSTGYADPTNTRDPYFTVVSTGADGVSLGGRNAPTSSYAGYSPILYFDTIRGEYVGGMFWDGRMTGEVLKDPLAEQAQGPPLNPVEMAMPDVDAVVDVVRNSSYANLFLSVFPNTNWTNVDAVYDDIGRAIAAYERSAEVQQFKSRYDSNNLSASEKRGRVLFDQHCNTCHTRSYEINNSKTVDIFTSYSYANIGIPANPLVPLTEPDKGLGYTITDDPEQLGKFKIPTLRNVGLTAPYGHNGYFPTLKSIIEFKNKTRVDLKPEIEENISPLIGNMGMSSKEVDDLVQFLMALSDN